MRYSTLAAILVAACVFATSRSSSAQALMQHSYGCSLVNNTSPYTLISGSYGGTVFKNNSGSSAWIMCPVTCGTGNTDFAIWTSTNVSYCMLYSSDGSGNYTYWPLTSYTSGYYDWANVTACSNGSAALEIQCWVPNTGGVYFYRAN